MNSLKLRIKKLSTVESEAIVGRTYLQRFGDYVSGLTGINLVRQHNWFGAIHQKHISYERKTQLELLKEFREFIIAMRDHSSTDAFDMALRYYVQYEPLWLAKVFKAIILDLGLSRVYNVDSVYYRVTERRQDLPIVPADLGDTTSSSTRVKKGLIKYADPMQGAYRFKEVVVDPNDERNDYVDILDCYFVPVEVVANDVVYAPHTVVMPEVVAAKERSRYHMAFARLHPEWTEEQVAAKCEIFEAKLRSHEESLKTVIYHLNSAHQQMVHGVIRSSQVVANSMGYFLGAVKRRSADTVVQVSDLVNTRIKNTLSTNATAASDSFDVDDTVVVLGEILTQLSKNYVAAAYDINLPEVRFRREDIVTFQEALGEDHPLFRKMVSMIGYHTSPVIEGERVLRRPLVYNVGKMIGELVFDATQVGGSTLAVYLMYRALPNVPYRMHYDATDIEVLKAILGASTILSMARILSRETFRKIAPLIKGKEQSKL